MINPNRHIPDWTEQDGPYEEFESKEQYTHYQEDKDEEDRYDKK